MSQKARNPREQVLIFIIIILVLTIITVISWRAGTSDIVVNQINLAGSLTSIVLAILAIVYAFIQTRASADENQSIKYSLIQIEKNMHDLNRITAELEFIKTQIYRNDGVYSIVSKELPDSESKNNNQRIILDLLSRDPGTYYSNRDIVKHLLAEGKMLSPMTLSLELGLLTALGYLDKINGSEGEELYAFEVE